MKSRELKFKLWNPPSKKFLYDAENIYECMKQQAIYEGCESCYGSKLGYNHKEDGILWCQSTGLFDKNGVEIFEGDIISTTDLKYSYYVVFENGSFTCYSTTNKDLINGGHLRWGLLSRAFEIKEFELIVVGNVFQNPELLVKCEKE